MVTSIQWSSLQKSVSKLTPKSFMRSTPGAYPSVAHLARSPIGLAPALPRNIRLDWKSLPGTNTLAITKIRNLRPQKIYNIGPWLN
jgi:hypothetical protein